MSAAARRPEGPSEDGPLRLLVPQQGGPLAPARRRPFGQAGAVADAVLYEGYLLYPYRRSSPKNQVRWQFGVLAPRAVVEAAGRPDTSVAGAADGWYQQTECLLEAADDAALHVRLRYLQVQHRAVERRTDDGWAPVDALDVGGRRHLTFDEAVPHEIDVETTVGALREAACRVDAGRPGGEEVEPLADPAGHDVGRVVRRRWPLAATLRLEIDDPPAPFPVHRLRLVVENGTEGVPPQTDRALALRRSLVAAHCLAAVEGGSFVSLLDPPMWAAEAAAGCTNVHTFPVLAGADGEDDVVLSSPIILYDHPRIAPESPGPLFDSGEIDEILSLRTLTLSDEEKAEARATDPQAAELLDRVDHLPDEVWSRLHGAIRSLRPAAAEPDRVLVGGTAVGPGSRVRLRPPRHGTDAQDIFLAGRTATVDRVLHDVDGTRFVAVTLDDDPGADLIADYGRFYQFTADEIEALP